MIEENKFASWLCSLVSVSENKKYRHRLLTEYPDKRDEILEELASYVQDAHEDARNSLRTLFANTLDPFADSSSFDPAEGYPERLHMQTLKGYFGEIFAGLIAEHFAPFDESSWKVPTFLFRYHTTAFEELERIRQDSNATPKKIPGRTGDDCLAFQLSGDGQIARYLYCEAKCISGRCRDDKVAEAHKKASESSTVNLMQVIHILQQRSDAASNQLIPAIQHLSLFLRKLLPDAPDYKPERCDMVSYICTQSPKRGERVAWLQTDKPHEEYKADRRLETVEIHLPEVDTLIQSVYGKKLGAKVYASPSTIIRD